MHVRYTNVNLFISTSKQVSFDCCGSVGLCSKKLKERNLVCLQLFSFFLPGKSFTQVHCMSSVWLIILSHLYFKPAFFEGRGVGRGG